MTGHGEDTASRPVNEDPVGEARYDVTTTTLHLVAEHRPASWTRS